MRRMSHKIQNINKRAEMIKIDQIKILELKITMTEMTHLPEKL